MRDLERGRTVQRNRNLLRGEGEPRARRPRRELVLGLVESILALISQVAQQLHNVWREAAKLRVHDYYHGMKEQTLLGSVSLSGWTEHTRALSVHTYAVVGHWTRS